jgi:hypothetical protein
MNKTIFDKIVIFIGSILYVGMVLFIVGLLLWIFVGSLGQSYF